SIDGEVTGNNHLQEAKRKKLALLTAPPNKYLAAGSLSAISSSSACAQGKEPLKSGLKPQTSKNKNVDTRRMCYDLQRTLQGNRAA
ncbi:MAG TPA: hypothetical protein VGB05_02230, partial [Pyrinomonadaceae bacterium]